MVNQPNYITRVQYKTQDPQVLKRQLLLLETYNGVILEIWIYFIAIVADNFITSLDLACL